MSLSPDEARTRRVALELSWLPTARKQIDKHLETNWNEGWIDAIAAFRFETFCLESLKEGYEKSGWVVAARTGSGRQHSCTLFRFRAKNWWDRFLDHFRQD